MVMSSNWNLLKPGVPDRRRRALSDASYRLHTVSELAKAATDGAPRAAAADSDAGAPEAAATGPRGPEWGTVVHAALAQGGHLSDDELERLCRALLIQHDRPLDAHAEPVELQDLLELVARVQSSDVWARAAASPRCLVEVPFQCELESGASPSVLEGVIDLAFQEGDEWVIVDYKTDVGDDTGFAERLVQYRAQVELYGDAWSRLTNQAVGERLLFFTAQDRVERC